MPQSQQWERATRVRDVQAPQVCRAGSGQFPRMAPVYAAQLPLSSVHIQAASAVEHLTGWTFRSTLRSSPLIADSITVFGGAGCA